MNKFYKYFITVFIVLLAGFFAVAVNKTKPTGAIPSLNVPSVFAFSSKEAEIRFGYDRFGIEKTEKNSFVYKNKVTAHEFF